MIFNSIDFALFLPIVFILYWLMSKLHFRYQNILLIGAGYVFYGWWNWRFLSLLVLTTIVDYFVGRGFLKTEKPQNRKMLLFASLCFNLGLLLFFKYYNFFLSSFITAFSFLGKPISVDSLYIILPVGISFYTFQSLSYNIDAYNRKLQPTNDFIAFSAFVGFFPQLVAGPIERAKNLLPQFEKKRNVDYYKITDGLRQIVWGLFKKIVIADGCAEWANICFNYTKDYNGSMLLCGAVYFAIQIYCDFSGYSDIAIGTAKLFGFDLYKGY